MPDKNHQVSFERHGNEWSADGKHAKEHKMKFDKGSGKHKVAFNIGTPVGRYLFNQDDPIWVKADDGECPQAASSHSDIEVEDCRPTRLVINNKNETEGPLRYQLNVYDTANREWCPIDPILDNGGHNRS